MLICWVGVWITPALLLSERKQVVCCLCSLDFINFLLYIFLFRGERKRRASCKTPDLPQLLLPLFILFFPLSLSLHEFHFLNWQRGSKPAAPNRIISAADNKQKAKPGSRHNKEENSSEVDILLVRSNHMWR